MSTGHVEYASLNGTHIFKLIGEVRAQSCISLDKLLNKIEQQNVVGAIVDLTQTTFIDSTVLGILAKLGLKLKQTHQTQVIMLSTNPDITTLANSMGLGQVFIILNDNYDDVGVCTKALADEQITQNSMLSTVLDAHRTLIKLNKNNHNMFEPLVKQLEKEQKNTALTSDQQGV